ncbi:MAG: cytochrome c [Dongiaceae bacterium]
MRHRIAAAALAATLLIGFNHGASASEAQVKRGKYLVSVISCGDCHTDGALAGKPDLEHPLNGSTIGFQIPGLGIFYGSNLTPDAETGLGSWSSAQIVAALTKGVRPDGRTLAPIMPWRSFANLTAKDAEAIAAYLKSLPPVKHKVPGPFGPSEKATAPYMSVVMPGQ